MISENPGRPGIDGSAKGEWEFEGSGTGKRLSLTRLGN